MSRYAVAPIKKGDTVGKIIYTIDGVTVKEIDVVACEDVPEKKKNGHFFGIF